MRTALAPLLLAIACAGQPGGDTGGPGDSGDSGQPASTATGQPTSSSGPPAATTIDASPTTSSTTHAGTTADTPATTTTGGLECAGGFPPHWIDGTDCTEPEIQVHAYDDDTWILRQSLCTSFEGPFLYLLFGSERALLLDTGDGGIPLAETVADLVAERERSHGVDLELIVTHTHAHGDHTAGDETFVGAADTTIVGPGVGAVTEFFAIPDWPNQVVQYDLGGRVLDIVPIPGHEQAHIAVHDRATGVAFTGDTLYPGRLYIADFPAYVASVGRLVDHLAGQTVCHVLGAHIEMTTTPGEDFDFMQPSHPDEHPLALDLAHLLELRAAVEAMDQPALEVHDDFIIYPL